jgi:two-component system response regulator BaeR
MMANPYILIVEDEKKIALLLRDYLERAGYSVAAKERGDQVIPCVQSRVPDLILLDVMLPGMDGMEVCRQVRKFSRVPVIMITAGVDEIDRLIDLEIGADDYVCKPFSPSEVVARVKAVLRRAHPEQEEKKFKAGVIELDEDKRRVTVNGRELKLTPIEYGLLKTLMARPDRIFTREELISAVLRHQFEGYDRTIDSHIKNLRKKIAAQLPDQQVIIAVYGFGYKLGPPPQ